MMGGGMMGISRSSATGSSDAGPSVATIFVRLIAVLAQ